MTTEEPWPHQVAYRKKDTHLVRARRFLAGRGECHLGYHAGRWYSGIGPHWVEEDLEGLRHEIRCTNPANTIDAAGITAMIRELRDICWLDESPIPEEFTTEEGRYIDAFLDSD